MTAHLAVLLAFAEKWAKGDSEEEPYVWWGKVRSQNRQGGLRHLDQIKEIGMELVADESRECYLYLTDYRSLYVAQVDEIRQDDVRTEDQDHVPGYYTTAGLQCDFWYKLLDIRRLVSDDTPVVIAKLKRLRNTGYNDRPVSLYGGMVDLPLVVWREEEELLFDPVDRGPIRDDRLWAEIDAEAVGVGKVERDLRENLFGDEAWLELDPGARTFIAGAEKILREERGDPAFDFGPVVANFAKAIEVTCNAILRRVAPRIPAGMRAVPFGTDTIQLGGGALTTGQLASVLGRPLIQKQLRQHLENGDWFVEQFPRLLRQLVELRNAGVHRDHVSREAALRLRDALVGVGCQGALVELSKVRVRR